MGDTTRRLGWLRGVGLLTTGGLFAVSLALPITHPQPQNMDDDNLGWAALVFGPLSLLTPLGLVWLANPLGWAAMIDIARGRWSAARGWARWAALAAVSYWPFMRLMAGERAVVWDRFSGYYCWAGWAVLVYALATVGGRWQLSRPSRLQSLPTREEESCSR